MPITLISTTFTREQIDSYLQADESYFAELTQISDVTIVELPTGHWPRADRARRPRGRDSCCPLM
ncbi:hypothetical protein [Aeromicrobium sp. UC242_57]|uniref:hypothetical protein n=1 Tax=Aeromicrobium sp. UC242_57 TaxID=3374624 RepID=UPI00378840B1